MPRVPSEASFGVIGIDLSLRRTALVHVPAGWMPGHTTGRIWVEYAGYELDDAKSIRAKTRRIDDIVRAVLAFVDRSGCSQVYIEDYAFSLSATARTYVAELAGAVKYALFRLGVIVVPVHMTRARSLFLGKIPKGRGAAAWAVQVALKRMGFDWVGADAGDAFVVANYARSVLGDIAITGAYTPDLATAQVLVGPARKRAARRGT